MIGYALLFCMKSRTLAATPSVNEPKFAMFPCVPPAPVERSPGTCTMFNGLKFVQPPAPCEVPGSPDSPVPHASTFWMLFCVIGAPMPCKKPIAHAVGVATSEGDCPVDATAPAGRVVCVGI